MLHMRRREFITLLGGAAALADGDARAAAGDAGDRIPERSITPHMGAHAGLFQ